MKKVTLVFLVIFLAALLNSCIGKKGETIVNNTYVSFNISEDSLWEPTNGPYGAYISDIKINNKDEIFLACNNKFLKSLNNGNSWIDLTLNIKDTIYNAKINDRFELIAYTNKGIFYSKDDGISWTKIFDSIPGTNYSNFFNIDSKHNIYASGNIYSIQKSFIYKSTDFGKNWISTLENKVQPRVIFIDNKDNIFAAYFYESTYSYQILASDDFGVSWREIIKINGGYNNVNPLFQDFSGNLYLINYPILKTTDNGKTWIQLSLNGLRTESISSIHFSNKGNIYLVTNWGIRRSTDNGNSWRQFINTSQYYISNICLDSKGYLYALLGNGNICRTRKPIE